MKEKIRIIFSDEIKYDDSKANMCRMRTIISVILGLAALVMLIMNIRNNATIMSYASIVLVAGFAASAVVAGVFKKAQASAIIIALLVCFVLSVFAVTGGNEGFAILWILLVPIFATSLIGVIPGLILETYFCIFLFVLFYSPLSSMVEGKYTISFLSKFPILYLADYAVAVYFSLQREYYQKRLRYEAYTDGMTGLFNRRTFMDILARLKDKGEYAIVMVDLNGLKSVNDTFGHEAGDDFIKKVSLLCKNEFKSYGYVCRIGGDEIAIVLNDMPADLEARVEGLHEKAKAMEKELVYKMSFSTGIAFSANYPSLLPESIYKIADEEMYKAKMIYYKQHQQNRRRFPRIDVDAKGAFKIKAAEFGNQSFIGKISDISLMGVRIEADYKEYKDCLEKINEGEIINFEAEEAFEVAGKTRTEVFNGEAEIVHKHTDGNKMFLGCQVKPHGGSFEEYVEMRQGAD